MNMNDTLKEHLAIESPSTGDAREMLHIAGEPDRLTRYDLDYAGNHYLMALDEIAALEAANAALRTQRDELVAALEKAQTIFFNHHEYGHIIQAYENVFRENCDVCEKHDFDFDAVIAKAKAKAGS
jgi:hypothetical protein